MWVPAATHCFTQKTTDEKTELGHTIFEFEDVVELREAITTYSVSIRRDIKYFKNDKTRIGAKCKQKTKVALGIYGHQQRVKMIA
ncbi:Intermediate capsid protein VP6 [Bienertia sinuspersici]